MGGEMEELKDFRDRLERHFQRLTKSEQKIASFLLANYDQAVFLNAADLGRELEVSEATVVRFARTIGYDSFPQFRRSLQHIFRVKTTPATRLQHKLADLKTGEGHILTQVVDMELHYLSEVPHSVSPTDFDRAVKIILKGKRIFVFGSGPSRILADLVNIRFTRFGLSVMCMTESGRDLIDKLLLLEHDDVVLILGFHRLTGELVAVSDRAHKVGCKMVLLTDTLAAHFKEQAAVILAARRGPVSTFHSLIVPMAILNAIILAVAMECPGESLASLKRLQELRAEYGLDVLGKVNSWS
jgi:DNA-binding MurR/RpiR family transcriptional regulator